MAGGIDPVYLDNAKEYAAMRRAVYEIDIAPLPDNLPLSANDKALNRNLDWRPKHVEVKSALS